MGLTRFAITRPLAILMFLTGLVIMGLVARSLLKVDRMPAMRAPFVGVNVSYPGASPVDVESLVLTQIEDGIAGLSGVSGISASASEGRGNVGLQLVEDADADKVAIDVERRMAQIRPRLPAEVTTSVNMADPSARPVMNIALVGSRSQSQLFDIASSEVQARVQSILGVADVNVSGGLQSEVQVRLDYAKMEAYGVSVQQVQTALTRENVSSPAGSMVEGKQSVNIRSIGQFQTLSDLSDLVIATGSSGTVRLRDVATITQGYKPITRYQRFNGQDAVGLSIAKQSDANSLQVADDLRAGLARIEETLPAGVRLIVTNDDSRYTRAALDAVQRDLALAVLLTGLVLLLFLHTWRNTLIVVLAIPTSLVSTFLVMYALGFTLDTISLMALALMIGILVDDSIVVLENIYRHLHLGEPPMLAALKGRSEIGQAAIAITMTDVVVYLPVAFMQGNIGRLYREYGITIAAATLFSLLVSFTLTPMLASRWLKARDGSGRRNLASGFTDAWEAGYERVRRVYRRTLGWAVRHRPVVLLVGAAALAAALALVQFRVIGMEYQPQEDDNQFSVNLQLPTGTSLAQSDQAVRQIEAALQAMPEVEGLFTTVGGGGMGGGNSGNISVQLVDRSRRQRTVFEIMNDARRLGTLIPDGNLQVSGGGGFGGFGGVQIRIQGDDLDTLTALAGQVEQVARQTPGVVGVRTAATSGLPEIRAVLDRKRMAELGLTATQVSSTLRAAISGSVATELRPEGRDQIDVTLVGNNPDKLDLNALAAIPIASSSGNVVRLGQVATLQRASSPAVINRQDRQRVVSISGGVADRPLGDVARDLRENVKSIPVPEGYRITVGGSVQQLDAAFAALTSALSLSVVLIYMLLVALYESWLDPLAIMFALPVALVGAFGGLLVTGNTFNVFSMIGMIMLLGLVAKNAILLVDFTKQLRARGMSRTEALLEAGPIRLRPILMTTATIVAAMTPLALKLEAGAESRAPMAVVVIGGVISSTLLTLVLVPVVYTYLDDLRSLLQRRLARAPAEAPAHAVPDVAGGSADAAEAR